MASVATSWESTFAGWTGQASDSEQERYDRTRREIETTLKKHPALEGYSFRVYPKGSYPNFTNVVRDSDVDIAAELTELFKNDFIGKAEGLSLADVGVTPYTGDYDLPAFKNDVEQALRDTFGSTVNRGNKAIHIRGGSGGLDADVVPCVEHRTWTSRGNYWKGIRLRDDSNPRAEIDNYPEQHLERGIAKNDRTNRRYKRVVRILKRLENKMVDDGVIDPVASFLIESAIWNVPDLKLTGPDTWTGRVRNALAHLFNGTLTDECYCSDEWMEANGIKYLFHLNQAWKFADAHRFDDAAWDYIGFD
jgi:hypothetical protein